MSFCYKNAPNCPSEIHSVSVALNKSRREVLWLELLFQNTSLFITLGMTVILVRSPNSWRTSQVQLPVYSVVIQTVLGFVLALDLGGARPCFVLIFHHWYCLRMIYSSAWHCFWCWNNSHVRCKHHRDLKSGHCPFCPLLESGEQ